MLQEYINKISEIAGYGDAREESYYNALAVLLEKYARSIERNNIHVTTLPKKTDAGNPDFRVWDGQQHITGYIEAKSPVTEHLDQIETTTQLKRYLYTFPNLILTNFFEFRLYRNGLLIESVKIGRPIIAYKHKTAPPLENENELKNLLHKFISFSLPKAYNSRSLAVELAKRTRFLKDEVISREMEEGKDENEVLIRFYEAFREFLISGLTRQAFADLYSQTVTYGLFAARTRAENGFNRKLAYSNIPRTIGVLRDIFKYISLGDLPLQMEWIIDDISEVLAVADVKQILHQFYREGKGSDPIFHFYETFLSEYDPETREKRGVYYTPEPVVSYIVRSLNFILKDRFHKTDGFASQSVTVLDPAAGTLTFSVGAAKLAMEEFEKKFGEGGKEKFIRDHILKNFYAFELMMAPYAAGHLKMSYILEEMGYKLKGKERFKLYLTNALEMEELAQINLPFLSTISEESRKAGEVKKEKPILVIMGNPPYSGISANASDKEVNIGKGQRYITHYLIDKKKESSFVLIPQTREASRAITKKQKTWIGEQIENYKIIDGHWMQEKNPKWIQDDYVKFIRFAQYKIDKEGEGVLGFITNHSYLDNPTFRGMRQSLMNSFDEIYILDLHGNSLKKEKCPDGSKDENVFDIRQGVAIGIFVKRKNKKKKEGCKVFHKDIWGTRESKFKWLLDNDITTTNWNEISPHSKFYFYIERDEELLEKYNKYPKINEIFPVNSVGVVTSRDRLVIDFDKETLKNRFRMFINKNIPDEIIRKTFNLKDKSNWKLSEVRKKIMQDEKRKDSLKKILYRPFDVRWIFYHPEIIERSRIEVMNHFLKGNLGICVGRAGHVVGIEKPWNIIFCTNNITDLNLFYRGGNVIFPLYYYLDNNNEDDLLNHLDEKEKKEPNVNSLLIKKISDIFKHDFTPEDVFFYVYSLLFSEDYRVKYADFLKLDFPRIPFTKDYDLFVEMSNLGKRLVDLHLLKSSELDLPVSKFHGKGDCGVRKIKYDEEEGRVYINRDQYFDGILPDTWDYQVGGYQVCRKWLKDRKKRILSLEEIRHYCRIVTSLKKTMEIQDEIDDIYSEVEIDTIEFG